MMKGLSYEEIGERIVYEDSLVLVFDKPAGLLSQGDSTGDADALALLKGYLKIRDNKPGNVWLSVVHRLDRMVGGLLLFAKSSKAASRLSEEIREKRVIKRYVAWVHGRVEGVQVWEDYLSKSMRGGRYFVTDSKQGRLARLVVRGDDYELKRDISRIFIELETGRPHQIRLQAASRGHGVLGDRRYGVGSYLDGVLKGPAMYSQFLGFKHPTEPRCVMVSLSLRGLEAV